MSDGEAYQLLLYVAGDAPNSARARANLNDFCRRVLQDRHALEVIDVLQDPQRALADGVYLTPMLVKLAPSPARRIVGNLSDLQRLLDALGLAGA
jgi:circadian clock protein KaiB